MKTAKLARELVHLAQTIMEAVNKSVRINLEEFNARVGKPL